MVKEKEEIEKKKNIIIVTGAASGMGKEFLKQIRIKEKNIDEIWAIDIDSEGLKYIEKEFEKIVTINMDLTKESDYELLNNKLLETKPNIKILANCAGFGIFDHNENIDLDTKQNMIDLNCKAYVYMIDYCLPYMNKGSHIMNIASCAGFQPIPYINLYAATKSFVVSYSRALNKELKYRGIHVLTVCPFWTKTKFFDRAVVKDKKEVIINYSCMYFPEDVVKKAIKDLYRKREMSVYGWTNKIQRFLVKILPHKLVMKVWMMNQKFDGTPSIR